MAEETKVRYFVIPGAVQAIVFWVCHLVFRAILLCCVRVRTVRPFPADLPGGCIVASNHNSHLDAHVLGSLIRRKIDWMSRIEFFKNPLSSFLLHSVSAIPLNRQGVPIRAIRTAVLRLQSNGNIGICPEGEVRAGPDSAIYGGKIKRGAGLLAYRTGAPVVPCVILGVESLCQISPWLPARRGEVWVNFGAPIRPRLDLTPRESREYLSRELETQFCDLYRQICERYPLPPHVLP